MTHKSTTPILTTLGVAAALLTSTAVQADSFGYVGATGIYGSAANTEDSFVETAVAAKIDGAYAFTLGNGGTLVVDGMYRVDNYVPSTHDGDASLPQYQASVHYIHPMSGNLSLNGFAGYGVAPFDDTNEVYQVGFVGAGVTYVSSDTTSFFGQAGYGTSGDADAMSSAGFYNGYFVRAGVIYTGMESAIIRVDAEYAATEEYEDSSEPGEMWSVAVSGESQLGSNENLVVTYGVGYGFYDAVGDPDLLAETTASVGVRYMFGGATPSKFASLGYVGSPNLPLRGSFWTPTMD